MRLDRKYVTRNGLPITLLTTDGRGEYCVVGYVGDSELVYRWNNEGRNTSNTSYDAIEVVTPCYLYFRMDDGEVWSKSPVPSEDLDRILRSEHTLRVNLRHPFDTKVMPPNT